MSNKRLLSIDPNAYTTGDVVEWLGLIGFEPYQTAFRTNEVDGAALMELDDGDLEHLGIKRLGDRKQLMRKIQALKKQTTSAWDRNVEHNSSSSSSSQTSSSKSGSSKPGKKRDKDEKLKLKVTCDGEVSVVKIRPSDRFSSVLRRVRHAVGIDCELSYKDGSDEIRIKDRRAWKSYVADCLDSGAQMRVIAKGLQGSQGAASKVELSSAVRGIYDGMGDAVVLLDPQGTILLFNDAATKLFKWTAREAVGQNIKILMSKRDGDSHDFYLHRFFRDPSATKIVGKGSRLVIAMAKDRSDVPVELSVSAHKDDRGNDYLVGMLRPSARADDAENPAAKYEVLNGLLMPAFVIDMEGEVIFVNGAVEEQLGYQSLDVLGENISDVLPEPHRSKHDSYLKRYLETGEAHVIGTKRKLSIMHKDGRELPCELTVTQMGRGDTRTFTGVVEILEEEMTGAEYVAKMDKKLGKLMIAACCIDGKGLIRSVNATFLRTFGYTEAKELMGNNVKMLMPDNIAIKHDGYLKSYLSDTSRDSTVVGKGRQVSAMRKDGTLFPAYLAVKHATDTEGNHFLTATIQTS